MAKRRRSRASSRASTPTGRVVGRTRPIASVSPGERRLPLPAILGAVAVVGAIVILGFGLFSSSGAPYACATQLQPQANATVENPIVTPNQGFNHVPVGQRIDYGSCPPASGPHYSAGGIAPIRPGFYDPSSSVGPGNWVHNLEHGYVIALYRCADGVCPTDDVLGELREFVANGPSTDAAVRCGYQSKVLAARFDQMATPFALLAWDRVLLLDTFDASTALDFARTWIEKTGREPNNC